MYSISEYWTPLKYHPIQAQLWSTKKQFVAAVAGRGSGKTELARRKTVLSLALKKPWPDPIYVYALPTYPQARKIGWYPILRLIPKEWIAKDGINKTESCITTIFGSKLYIVGMDKPHRIEGLQIDGVVLDESSDQRPEGYSKTILPMLTHRKAWCWRIGVPKKSGIGRADFKEFFDKGLNPNSKIAAFTWKSADILTEEELEIYKEQMTAQDFSEQFEAVWLDAGGTIYYNFSTERNISNDALYDPIYPIYVGCDFNVNPMCWVLGHFVDGVFRIFDEIFLRDTNTEAALNYLYTRYSNHLSGWNFIGDASARQRKTSASRTDYLIIKNDTRFGDKKVFFPKKNLPINDRYATVNAAFYNAKGDVRLIVNKKCTFLINDFMKMTFKEGTCEPEDYSGTDIGHMSDALGYCVAKILPMRINLNAAPEVIIR